MIVVSAPLPLWVFPACRPGRVGFSEGMEEGGAVFSAEAREEEAAPLMGSVEMLKLKDRKPFCPPEGRRPKEKTLDLVRL